MLKTMEKLVDRHIRDNVFGLRPVYQHQFAYQPGKSTETALHHIIIHIQEAVENSQITLGAFLHTERAFDSTSSDITTKAAKRQGLEDMMSLDWLHVPQQEDLQPLLQDKLWRGLWPGVVRKGTFLSPLLWSLVVDELMGGLNRS
jgi:phosphoglycerate-specific signal transduction histidine kinase